MTTTVAATGDLDLAVTARFQDKLADEVRRRPATLIVDLTDVTFISSRGLAILLEAVTTAHSHGIACAVIASHHAVLRPIKALRLERVLPVHTDHAAAEMSLAPRAFSPFEQ
ncbi:STAS domain-containing protein [Amycolatopsis sp. lyj-84]|uniref:STAS domain-containing protein n=1 Tax=Amycolatopsis sp. lyj-84 TaxID=2789284 RepID=UPI00397D994D